MGIVVGLAGLAGSGKGTVAAHLEKAYGFAEFGFSWPLKKLCADEYGWNMTRLNDDPAYKEEQAPGLPPRWTRRRVLQHIGTEGFRAVDPDHWTKRAAEAVADLLAHPDVRGVVLSDVRFPNEVELVRRVFGGTVVRTVCAGRATHTKATEHESEKLVAGLEVDHVLEARFGDLDGLRARAGAYVEGLLARVTFPHPGATHEEEES